MAEQPASPETPRPFWSGTIAFGLVSLPVSLHAAHRGRPAVLRMVDDDGTPLARRMVCERDGETLSREDIVRGYPLDEERFVVVEDDELAAAAPEKSREIDLTRFVRRDQIDPMYFERAYVLVPEQGATKAYRLLAEAMAREQRAGIATFVMREHEYLAAIVAENGVLRVETLRFADELRAPEQIGLPSPREPSSARVAELRRAIEADSDDDFDRDALRDTQAQRLLALVRRKLDAGRDVIHPPALEAADDSDDDDEFSGEPDIVDLMQVLRQRLQAGDPGSGAARDRRPRPASRSPKASRSAPRKSAERAPRTRRTPALEDLSRDELYQRAQELQIAGRSQMSKAQLIRAIGRQH